MLVFLLYFIGMNIAGFCAMYIDKKRAIKGEYRIKEKVLWNYAFLGGAIGTTIGMKRFRHKTKHRAFAIGFPLLAVVYVGLFFYIMYLFYCAN